MNSGSNISQGYLNKESLCSFLGGNTKPLGKSTINDWMRTKNFPQPIRISQTLTIWRITDVIAWIEEQDSERRNTHV